MTILKRRYVCVKSATQHGGRGGLSQNSPVQPRSDRVGALLSSTATDHRGTPERRPRATTGAIRAGDDRAELAGSSSRNARPQHRKNARRNARLFLCRWISSRAIGAAPGFSSVGLSVLECCRRGARCNNCLGLRGNVVDSPDCQAGVWVSRGSTGRAAESSGRATGGSRRSEPPRRRQMRPPDLSVAGSTGTNQR